MDERQYKERILNFRETEGSKLYPEYPLKGLHIELSNICNHQCLLRQQKDEQKERIYG